MTTSNNPIIRIKNGWLIQGMIDDYLSQIPDIRHIAPSPEEFKEKVEERQALWGASGDMILNGMKKLTGLDFNEKIIDVYIVHGFHRAFSDPLVVSVKYSSVEFVDVLTHEIIHRLLTDNTDHIDVSAWIRNKFKDVDNTQAINHIFVHAVHEAIYRDVLYDPHRFEADVINCQKFPGYKLAWEVVSKFGYKNIISDFKKENRLER